MADILNPQFKIPFQMDSSGFIREVEQDTDEEILQNAVVVLRYRNGQRLELPEFGIPDQTFLQGGVNMDVIVGAIQRWEPDVEVEDILNILQDGENQVIIELSLAGEEPTNA